MRIRSIARRSTHLRFASALAVGAVFIALAGCTAEGATPPPEPSVGTATEAIDGFNAMAGTARHDALAAAA